MSSVPLARVRQVPTNTIEADSLLEYLYSFFTLDELKSMHRTHPGVATLRMWGVSLDEYQSQVLTAIDYVVHD